MPCSQFAKKYLTFISVRSFGVDWKLGERDAVIADSHRRLPASGGHRPMMRRADVADAVSTRATVMQRHQVTELFSAQITLEALTVRLPVGRPRGLLQDIQGVLGGVADHVYRLLYGLGNLANDDVVIGRRIRRRRRRRGATQSTVRVAAGGSGQRVHAATRVVAAHLRGHVTG